MNKYQEQMLQQTSATLKSVNGETGLVEINGNTLTLTQNENYNCLKYLLSFNNVSICSIDVKCGSKWINIKGAEINIDFQNPIEKIRLNFELVDPIEIIVKYIFADKVSYDLKISEEKKAEYKYESNARIVNNIFGVPTVIFNPCCSDYAYTEVEFIATKDSGTTSSVFPRPHTVFVGGSSYGSISNPPKKKDVYVVLQRKRNEEGCNYIQFTNIGECGLKAHIYQYNKKGQLLIDYEI